MRSTAKVSEAMFGSCVLCAFALIAYGACLVPGVSRTSLVATSAVLATYGILGWRWWLWQGASASGDRAVCWWFGIAGAAVFVVEIVLEYAVVPTDNSRWGLIEFGLVFLIYGLAAFVVTYGGSDLRTGIFAAVGTAVISSLVWYIAVLLTFYIFFGTERQELVFRAEGNYEDFARSGMANFNQFIMEDFLGAGFFHLLLGPAIAAILGVIGGLIGRGCRRLRVIAKEN